MDMNKDSLMKEQEDISFWILRLDYDGKETDSCEHLKVPSSVSYGDVVKACAYIIKIYELKNRDGFYYFPSNLEIALTLSRLYGFEAVNKDKYKNENIDENNRIKTIKIFYLCDHPYDPDKRFGYDKIVNKKLYFSRERERIKIEDEGEPPLLVFEQNKTEESIEAVRQSYPKGYFEKHKMKNYEIPHGQGIFLRLNTDFSSSSDATDKVLFIPEEEVTTRSDDLADRIFYLSEIHNQMRINDTLYRHHFNDLLSMVVLTKLLEYIYNVALFPEESVYRGDVSNFNLCGIQLCPDYNMFEKDYKNIVAPGVRRALMRFASEEVKDEAVKAAFIAKMDEYPVSNIPDEIDLIKIKDYYRQN